MAVSISSSVVEKFNFNGQNVRSLYIKDIGECLLAKDVYEAVGYERDAGIQAIQRLVPDAYKMRLGDIKNDLDKVIKNDNLHPDTVLLKESGLYCFLLRCKKEEAEPFMKWVVKTVLPREVRKLNKQLESKDKTILQLNDNLEATRQQIETLQENAEILKRRAVPYLQNSKKDNGLAIIQKNNGDDFPYVAICGQQGYVAQKIQNKLSDYPNGVIVVLGETPNAIVHYNWLRERGLIVVNPDRVRHFRLG